MPIVARFRLSRHSARLLPMRIAILGAGPAGLYLAYLIKRRAPDADVTRDRAERA